MSKEHATSPRILYVESAAIQGGSTESLFHLVSGLDRTRWAPELVTFTDLPAIPRFQALGIPVTTLGVGHPTTATTGAMTSHVKNLDTAQRLRTHPRGRALYQAGGATLRLGRRTLPHALRLARLIRAHQIDLVHTNGRVGYDHIGILGAILARRPVVAHIRDWDPLGPLDKLLLTQVAHLIYISQAMATDHYQQGIAPRRGSIIPNAVDLASYQRPATPSERATLRAEWGWPPESWVLALVARGVPWKGHAILLRALAHLRQTLPTLAPAAAAPPSPQSGLPDLRLLLVGAPGPQNSAYWAELQTLVHDLDLSAVVHFAGHRTDMDRIMPAIDLLVHCATAPEAFGRVLIEAGAAGIPVVASHTGGIPEVVRHGETGLLVPPGDVTALAEAIYTLATTPTLATTMGAAAQRHVATHFSLPQHVAAIEAIYRQVLHLD